MMPVALALLLLGAGALAMLAVPFIPMWSEWRHPTDHAPLPVRADDSNAIDFFARRLRADIAARPGAVRGNVHFVDGDLQTEAERKFGALLVEGDGTLGERNEIAVSEVVRYRAFTWGISSSRMNLRKASEPPTRGAIFLSSALSVGPVMSRRRSVFSIPTRRNGRIVPLPAETWTSPATCRKSSAMPPSGM
jgi:hypothetical protein